MFSFRENQNIGFLRPLVAAGLVLTGSSGRSWTPLFLRGESRQDERTPCRIRTRRRCRLEFRTDAFDAMLVALRSDSDMA